MAVETSGVGGHEGFSEVMVRNRKDQLINCSWNSKGGGHGGFSKVIAVENNFTGESLRSVFNHCMDLLNGFDWNLTSLR
jgi:hypothetical protein